MITNSNMENLTKALKHTNRYFNDNIQFNRLEQVSKNRIAFTLKVKNSSKDGAKLGISGRKTNHACWHVHGVFFDSLFNMNIHNKDCYVLAMGKKITKNEGNWVDYNVGSILCPVYASELCKCTTADNGYYKKS